MLNGWFILAVLAIPFNDFYGLLPLGEVRNDLSVYLFLPLLGCVVLQRLWGRQPARAGRGMPDPGSILPSLAFAVLATILLSGVVNIDALIGPDMRGRSPIGKFLGSAMVVAYGFGLAYLGYHFTRLASWHRMIVRPVCISIAFCAAFAVVEIAAAYSGAVATVYDLLSKAIHTGFAITGNLADNVADWRSVGRARSVCFEPPALATFAGLAWPWVYAGVATASRRQRPLYLGVLLLCTGLVVIAMSRTSAVLLVGNIAVYGLLRGVYLAPRPRSAHAIQIASVLAVALGVSFVAMYVLSLNALTEAILRDTDHVSNISRYSLITSGLSMFLARPFAGFGFGQFGFHFVKYLPSWGYYSWEIRYWVAGVDHSWPAVFSIYARFAAETGIIGLAAWIGVWLTLVRMIWRVTLSYQRATGQLLILSYPLIMSCCSALLTGLAVDSVRMPIMWLSMGIGCCYIQDVQQRLMLMRGARRRLVVPAVQAAFGSAVPVYRNAPGVPLAVTPGVGSRRWITPSQRGI